MIISSVLSVFETSNSTNSVEILLSFKEALSSSNFCDLLAAIVIEAPYSARATAHANPIPEEAPAIRARLFFNENEGVLGKFIGSSHQC